MKIEFWKILPNEIKDELNAMGSKQITKHGKEDEFTIRLMLNEIGFYKLETAIKHYMDIGHSREAVVSHIAACCENDEAQMLSLGEELYVRMFTEE